MSCLCRPTYGSRLCHDLSRATPLDCQELDKLPRPASGTIKVVRRPTGALIDTHAIQAPQSHAHAIYLRHEHVVPEQQSCIRWTASNQWHVGLWWHLGNKKNSIFL